MLYHFKKKKKKKKTTGGAVKREIMSNQELAEELCKPIIRKSEKRKVLLSFTDNICGADFANMQLIKRFVFWTCVSEVL